jgi:hypothetical protein
MITVNVVTTLQMTKIIFNRLATDTLRELILMSITRNRRDMPAADQKKSRHTNRKNSCNFDNFF